MMKTTLVIAFCAEPDRRRVAGALLTPDPPMLLWHDAAGVDIAAKHRPLHVLAVGPEGGAKLGRWVEEHGLDGVTGVGLVGVTAAWAEREECRCEGFALFGPCPHDRRPLGPLGPLRGVADRARLDCPQPCPYGANCEVCAGRPTAPLRLVIACAPDDGVCAECGGEGSIFVDAALRKDRTLADCDSCPPRTGKALSSKAVADELAGALGRADITTIAHGEPTQQTWGGLTVITYESSALLSAHGIEAALKALGPQ